MEHDVLKPEDYREPQCLLCDEPYGAAPAVRSIPQRRILEKMNDYMSRRDYDGAERHLKYWLEEARLGQDLRGELMLQNELVGHYRKTGNRAGAMNAADRAMELIGQLGFENTLSCGTACLNIATACHSFGEYDRAMELFRKARSLYEGAQKTSPELLGGLYNNMALTCVALQQYDLARELYQLAMEQMKQVRYGELEQAVTCLNLADLLEAELGAENAEGQIFSLLDQAYELLTAPELPRDGYYAFVCEKCAPGFSYYGYFSAARELQAKAEEIYAGT